MISTPASPVSTDQQTTSPASSGGAFSRPSPARQASLGHLRLRALMDMILIVGAVAVATFLIGAPDDRLLVGIGVASFGTLIYMIRRSQDLAAVQRRNREREAQLSGRGISLADWHAGKPLPAHVAREVGPSC